MQRSVRQLWSGITRCQLLSISSFCYIDNICIEHHHKSKDHLFLKILVVIDLCEMASLSSSSSVWNNCSELTSDEVLVDPAEKSYLCKIKHLQGTSALSV